MKELISCFNEHLKRIWLVIFAFVVFSNVNVFGLGNNVGHKLILNNFSETIVHKASIAEALRKTPLLFAYKPDTAYFLDDNEKVYMHTDKMPEFPGGLSGLQKFCSQNMHYPEQALTDSKSGTVQVGFIVGKDGTLRKARVVKSAGKELNEEALRVVQKMPNWIPGKLKKKEVPVYFVLPLAFEVSDESKNQYDGGDTLNMAKVPFTYIDQNRKKTVSSTSTNHEIIYTYVDHMPDFPGGTNALMNFLGENISYPLPALERDIQSTVVLRFIVETDGTLSNVQVIRSVGGGCDEEAVRVVKLMPNWVPGKLNEKNVRVYFVLPIKFVVKKK